MRLVPQIDPMRGIDNQDGVLLLALYSLACRMQGDHWNDPAYVQAKVYWMRAVTFLDELENQTFSHRSITGEVLGSVLFKDWDWIDEKILPYRREVHEG